MAALAVAAAPSKTLDSDLEAIAHAFDGFPSLWAHIGDLRREVERLERNCAQGPEAPERFGSHFVEVDDPEFSPKWPISPEDIERLRKLREAFEKSPMGGWGEPSLAAKDYQEAAANVVTKLLGPGPSLTLATHFLYPSAVRARTIWSMTHILWWSPSVEPYS